MISVESVGTVQQEIEEREKRIGEFIQFIQENKVVIIEDLAAEFNMKTAVS